MIRAAIAGLFMTGAAMADTTITYIEFSDLNGWEEDNHAAALGVFAETCGDLADPMWRPICEIAKSTTDARGFFETLFRPVLIEDGADMLFTGYFEPELRGSREFGGRFLFPLYGLPDEAVEGPWITRREIEETGALAGRGLELAWVDDPVDVFFLQVQGSGRVRLPDGSMMRVGYAGANGRDYSSVGMEMVRRGLFEPHEVSATRIRNWVRDNPEDGADLLRINDSYVFFREVSEVPSEHGPLGAMNRSVTPLRSIAVDPSHTPLGAPVWIEREGANRMHRLMIAQDTGSAIKGAQRADIFFGTGDEAGLLAGDVRDGGRMVVLLPIQSAYALLDR